MLTKGGLWRSVRHNADRGLRTQYCTYLQHENQATFEFLQIHSNVLTRSLPLPCDLKDTLCLKSISTPMIRFYNNSVAYLKYFAALEEQNEHKSVKSRGIEWPAEGLRHKRHLGRNGRKWSNHAANQLDRVHGTTRSHCRLRPLWLHLHHQKIFLHHHCQFLKIKKRSPKK